MRLRHPRSRVAHARHIVEEVSARMNFIYSFFNQPAIVIGVVALIGLIALRKSVDQIISGTLKTVIGFVVLSSGGGIISGALGNLTPAFESAFHV